MEAASDAGRSGIGGASMEATDEAGDKGADDADAGEDGMVTVEGGWSACEGHGRARFGSKQRGKQNYRKRQLRVRDLREGAEPAPALSQGLGGEAIMGDKKRNEEEKQQPGYHNSTGIAAEERVRLVESRYGVDKELCK